MLLDTSNIDTYSLIRVPGLAGNSSHGEGAAMLLRSLMTPCLRFLYSFGRTGPQPVSDRSPFCFGFALSEQIVKKQSYRKLVILDGVGAQVLGDI